MKKYLFVMLMLVLLGLVGCNQKPNMPSATEGPPIPSSSANSEHAGESEPVVDNESDAHQKTKVVTFSLPGNNAQSTDFSIEIPEDWSIDVDKLIDDEQIVARFGVALRYDGDLEAALEGLDAEYTYADAFRDLDVPGIEGRCYNIQTEEADGSKGNELRYYIFVGNRMVFITSTGIQIEEFETCLATLELKS